MMHSYLRRMAQRNPDCVFESLDPRCKVIICFVVTLAVILGNGTVSVGLFIGVGILACFAKLAKLFLAVTVFSIMFWLMLMLLLKYIFNKPFEESAAVFQGMVFRGTALSVTGFWFSFTTKLKDLCSALEAWHVPAVVILPLIIAVRFVPTLLNESRLIRDSMRLRRIGHRTKDILKNPRRIASGYVALVIIRSLRMADELAAVAETRGFGRPGYRAVHRPMLFKRSDGYAFAITGAAITLIMALSQFI